MSARLEQRLTDEGAWRAADADAVERRRGRRAPRSASRPALTALSGPAAGVVGARAAAQACGIDDIITVDIGGTSADICLVKDGRIGLTQAGSVGDWPLALPIVDMITIGAGGGSIARVDATARCRSARRAPAPRPGPPPTARAGPSRP